MIIRGLALSVLFFFFYLESIEHLSFKISFSMDAALMIQLLIIVYSFVSNLHMNAFFNWIMCQDAKHFPDY